MPKKGARSSQGAVVDFFAEPDRKRCTSFFFRPWTGGSDECVLDEELKAKAVDQLTQLDVAAMSMWKLKDLHDKFIEAKSVDWDLRDLEPHPLNARRLDVSRCSKFKYASFIESIP